MPPPTINTDVPVITNPHYLASNDVNKNCSGLALA